MCISHCLRRGAWISARPCGASFFGGMLRLVWFGRGLPNDGRQHLVCAGRKVNAWLRIFNAIGLIWRTRHRLLRRRVQPIHNTGS